LAAWYKSKVNAEIFRVSFDDNTMMIKLSLRKNGNFISAQTGPLKRWLSPMQGSQNVGDFFEVLFNCSANPN